ncbi:MAG TPA: sulfite exporter TauE/SafE family protein [Methylomirabilota bacterium]|nr:sulfite exporter TauE/SafE family protein [Methylomirabilota bacterium]
MTPNLLVLALIGIAVGIGAAFTGLGGGFLVVPLLLFLGYPAQKAVGTSFVAIVVISLSALVAHNKLANVDLKTGLLLGVGGIVGAQVGARLVEHISTAQFKRVFAVILVGLAAYLFFKK